MSYVKEASQPIIVYCDKYCETSVSEQFQRWDDENWRIWVVQGSMSAGKTVAAIIQMVEWAIGYPGTIGTIVADSLPRLRKDAMRIFLDYCRDTNLLKDSTWNATELTLTLSNGSIIEFCSIETLVGQGAKRDFLYVNEGNLLTWEQFSDIEPRTRKRVIVDFNPTNEFWAHTKLVQDKTREDVIFGKFTYRDNEGLDTESIAAIEARRGDGTSNWWRVYGLGEIGSLEGNVYQGWKSMAEEEVVKHGKLIRYGLDFGFSQDETALVALYDLGEMEEGAFGLVEKVYQKGILPSKYAELLKSQNIDPTVLIVADGARPEIIAEISEKGYLCISALKDAGSVKRGIDYVNEHPIYYSGKNLEREFLTYAWRRKKSTGEMLGVPQDGNDHMMDAIRYAVDDLYRPRFGF